MRVTHYRWGWASLIVLVAIVLTARHSHAQPYSPAYTDRESKAITAIAPTAPFARTYTALTQDSKDLTFYESPEGKIFIAFASKDGTLDDQGLNRCHAGSYYQVYWADRYQSQPAVCVSARASGMGNNDSYEPILGGSGEDEGRYVAYHTRSNNLIFYAPTATPTVDPSTPTPTHTPDGNPPTNTPTATPTPTAVQQVAFHDRKWGFNIPTCSKCAGEPAKICPPPLTDTYIWQMSKSGKDLLLTSNAIDMRDNRTPKCADDPTIKSIFIRDGSDCVENVPGACYTKRIDDNTGYQIFDPSFEILDDHSQNVRMLDDGSTVVFDTAATNPMHFTPDPFGHKDIYLNTKERFRRVTQAMVPFCSVKNELLPLTNEFGPPNGDSERPTVDSSGRYIAFESTADDMVVWEENPAMVCSTPGAPHPADIQYITRNGHKQVFYYDALKKRIFMVSTKYRSNPATTRAEGGNGDSSNARISDDGRFIWYHSRATDLLSTATTNKQNIFMYDRVLNRTFLVTPGTGGNGLNQDATLTGISHGGLSVAFQTNAIDVVVEGPEQGTSVGGSVPLNGGGTATAVQHVYIARHSCPLDTDGDLVPDCADLDKCPYDPNKTEEQECGCGKAETDTDKDLTPDCKDGCKTDAKKTAPGACGCGNPDTDSDYDGNPDCTDLCPENPQKTSPGKCGCGESDVDTDLDGSPDCIDACDTDPNKVGATACPCGSLKDSPGVCGCNTLDTDANKNGQPDCLDPTANTQPKAVQYVANQINLGGKNVFNILRVRMERFGGSLTYNYTIANKGFKRQFTSKSANIAYNGLKSGTYTFSYNITTGKGANKVTTKTTTTTIKIP